MSSTSSCTGRSLILVIARSTQTKLARQVSYLKAENQVLRSRLPDILILTEREKNRLVRFTDQGAYMTAAEILAQLKKMGNERTARVLQNHGAHTPCLGVKIGDMKPLQKQLRRNYAISLELYDSGIYDAMYLAGLIAEPDRMTKKDLTRWVKAASKPIASYVVGPVAAGSPAGWTQALAWIKSKKEIENIAGWATVSAVASICPDEKLDVDEFQNLLTEVERTIQMAKDAVRYQMNSFVISVGSCICSLTEPAIAAGHRIGVLKVELGNTNFEMQFAPGYIQKVKARGCIGKKRKSAMC